MLETNQQLASARGIQYQGWRTLAAMFACSLVAIGTTIYGFGLYVVPVSETLGVTRASANVGMMVFITAMAVWSPLAGSMLDRYSARWVVAAGGVLLASGLYLIPQSSSGVQMLAAIAGPIALGTACAGPLAAATVVSRWFRKRRGRALGIAATATAAGGFLMTQLGANLIVHYEWRSALSITAIASGLAVVAIALLVIKPNPSERDLQHGGETLVNKDTDSSEQDERIWRTRQLLRSRNFWLITVATGLVSASDAAILISKIPYLADIGFGLQAASFLVACQSASAVAGKIVIGIASERVDLRKLFIILAAAHLIMIATLIAKPGYAAMLTVFVCVGVAIGGIHPIYMNLVARAFGSRSYGAISGRMNFLQQPLSLGAIFFVGAAYDRYGNYDLAFGFFGVMVIIACLLVAAIRWDSNAL